MDLLGRMQTFVRVVEAGSLSAAARQLQISVAAVSRQMAGLERELGTKLLARNTRHVSVTSSGREYYERCLQIQRDVADAQAIGRRGEIQGVVRISMPVTIGVLSGYDLYCSLASKHPDLRLDIRLEDRVIDLVLEDVDVAIRVTAQPPLSTEIVAHSLAEWRQVAVASPGYVRKHGEPRTPAELTQHSALARRRGRRERWVLEDVQGERVLPIDLPVRHSCNEAHILRELLLGGCGVALMPTWFVAEDLKARRLRRLLPGWHSERVLVQALYRASQRHQPRVRALVDHLRETFLRTAR